MKHIYTLCISCLFLNISLIQAQTSFVNPIEEEEEVASFYDTKKVQEINITFKQKDWRSKLDSLRLYGNGLLVGKVNINGKSLENAGVRYRGSKSFKTGSTRNALHIKLNYINKDQNYMGYQTLKLSNSLRDPSMIREVLSYEIANKYMIAPKANYVKITINGEYYGLFANIEAIDDIFLEKNFGSAKNVFFKCSPNFNQVELDGCKNKIYASLEYESNAACYTNNYELKSDTGWDDLIELSKKLNKGTEGIEKVLNVDQTLWMLAFNNVLVNLSSYSGQNSQNYYLYKDNNGRFTPIIWDLNLSFGSFKNTGSGSDLDLKSLQRLDPLLHVDNIAKPLISQLLKNPLYRKIYLSHIRTIVYDYFVGGTYEKRAQELQRLIQVPFYNDQNKFYSSTEFTSSLNTTIGKRSKIPGIVELMSKRAKFLKKHPSISFAPPLVSDVKALKRAQFDRNKTTTFRIQAKVERFPKRVRLFYRYGNGDQFKETFMVDDGKHDDGEAGDKIFGINIDPKGKASSIEYYILAEDAGSVTFDPPSYMSQPYKANLSELN